MMELLHPTAAPKVQHKGKLTSRESAGFRTVASTGFRRSNVADSRETHRDVASHAWGMVSSRAKLRSRVLSKVSIVCDVSAPGVNSLRRQAR